MNHPHSRLTALILSAWLLSLCACGDDPASSANANANANANTSANNSAVEMGAADMDSSDQPADQVGDVGMDMSPEADIGDPIDMKPRSALEERIREVMFAGELFSDLPLSIQDAGKGFGILRWVFILRLSPDGTFAMESSRKDGEQDLGGTWRLEQTTDGEPDDPRDFTLFLKTSEGPEDLTRALLPIDEEIELFPDLDLGNDRVIFRYVVTDENNNEIQGRFYEPVPAQGVDLQDYLGGWAQMDDPDRLLGFQGFRILADAEDGYQLEQGRFLRQMMDTPERAFEPSQRGELSTFTSFDNHPFYVAKLRGVDGDDARTLVAGLLENEMDEPYFWNTKLYLGYLLTAPVRFGCFQNCDP